MPIKAGIEVVTEMHIKACSEFITEMPIKVGTEVVTGNAYQSRYGNCYRNAY